MEIYTATQARENLFKLIDYISESHEPICITGKRNKIVALAEEDFKALQETIYLLSIPNMRESIIKAKKAKRKDYSEELDW